MLFRIYGTLLLLVSRPELCCLQLSNHLKIDGIFETDNESAGLAFKWTTQKINLSRRNLTVPLLVYSAKTDAIPNDTFDVARHVCQKIGAGGKIIFGPRSKMSFKHVRSICRRLEIPHIYGHWQAPATFTKSDVDAYSLNLYPHYLTLSGAHRDVIQRWKWTKFTVIFEENDGLIRLQEILSLTTLPDVRINIRQFDKDKNSFIQLFKELKDMGEYRIVIDCTASLIKTVLKKAMQVNAVSEYFHYHFTNLDLGVVDLSPFIYSGANITGMSLINPDRPLVKTVTKEWEYEMISSASRISPLQPEQNKISVEAALMHDAVHLLFKAVQRVSRERKITFNDKVSCKEEQPWFDGRVLINYMKRVTFDGLTGRVQLDKHGDRTKFVLDITRLTTAGHKRIGYWDSRKGLTITEKPKKQSDASKDLLNNKTLSVITVVDPPYVFQNIDENGTVTYEGFCIDLMNEISTILGFKYHIIAEPTGTYGNCKGEVCTGMVKELVERKVDLALAGMTITFDREEVIDFTKPFWNLGITILFRKPKGAPTQLFKFLSPFTVELWVCVLAVYIAVSIMLFFIGRLTPYEWDNPYPCDPHNDALENQFSITNSLWFTIGALMQQGSEIAPKTTSTRLVAVVWWFFTLIMISSYTANMAAFLTIERMDNPIENVEDLANQEEIKYGTLGSGSTKSFFAESKSRIYKKMWNTMRAAAPSVFVKTSDEGEKRVLAGGYAYLAESTTVEYRVARNCDLMQVGQLLDSKGYGIGLPRDSPYRDKLSSVILHLQEDQSIRTLYDKWWKEKNIGEACAKKKAPATKALELKNVGGVFVLLIAGAVVGVVMAICEFWCNARKYANREERKILDEMREQFILAMRCFGSTKKPARKKEDIDDEDTDKKKLFENEVSLTTDKDSKDTIALKEYERKEHVIEETDEMSVTELGKRVCNLNENKNDIASLTKPTESEA